MCSSLTRFLDSSEGGVKFASTHNFLKEISMSIICMTCSTAKSYEHYICKTPEGDLGDLVFTCHAFVTHISVPVCVKTEESIVCSYRFEAAPKSQPIRA
jgi:hypothetical protein